MAFNINNNINTATESIEFVLRITGIPTIFHFFGKINC